MNNPVSIDDYCKTPEKYKYLEETTINYYDRICQLRKDPEKDFTYTFAAGVTKVIKGFLTPQNLAIMGAILGVKFTEKWAFIAVKNILNLSASRAAFIDECMSLAEKVGIDVGEVFFEECSAALVFTYIATGIRTLIVPILSIANVGIRFFEFFGWGLLLLQVITAIFDEIDPCDLKSQLTRTALLKISGQMDEAFRTIALNNYETTTDTFGRDITMTNNWPIEYYSDSLFQDNYKDYSTKIWLYSYLYLSNLDQDSNGNPIIRDNKKKGFITPNDFDLAVAEVSDFFSDNNVVVDNFINKWYPIIFAILIIIILIILLLK
jgi:hypothetical protein